MSTTQVGTGDKLAQFILQRGASANGARQGIGEVVHRLEDTLGSETFTDKGLLSSGVRAQYAKQEGVDDTALMEAVKEAVRHPQAARAVADMLLFPGAGVALDIQGQVSGTGQAKGLLEQINLKVENHGADRVVTVTKPVGSTFAGLYQELNKLGAGANRPAIWPESRLLAGPAQEESSDQAHDYTVTIHFGLGNKTRDKQETELNINGEKPADPFVLALAEAASRVKDGKSLFQLQGAKYPYVVRTAVADTKKGARVGALDSYAYGVNADDYNDVYHYDTVVAAGSPNHGN